jgi:hypothetical protein
LTNTYAVEVDNSVTGGIADGGAPPVADLDREPLDAPIGRRALARLVDFALGLIVFVGLR